MKPMIFIVVGFVALFRCNDEDQQTTVWGIEYASRNTMGSAAGTIDQQKSGDQQGGGVKVTYAVDKAYMLQLRDNVYRLRYTFTSADSLEIVISRQINDPDFHFSADQESNQLLYAVFNTDTLNIEDGMISVQPRTGENKITTLIDLHTPDAGDFYGKVNSIPLLKE